MLLRLQIDRREPFAQGMAFGAVGPYERLIGTASGELDPQHPLNRCIVNLEHAPRNARGGVTYEMDVYIVRPVDLRRGAGKLLYEVPNRGRKMLLPIMHEAKQTSPGAINDPATAADAGNGFTFERGYTLVWSGWDPDAPRANHGMGIRLPFAQRDGQLLQQTIRDEFVFGTRVPATRHTAPLSYPAANLDQAQARLTVRKCEHDARTEIAPQGWAYVDNRNIKLLPDGTPFQAGWIYDFWYPATRAPVLGMGFAATRDLVAFLRYELQDTEGTPNPVALTESSTGFRTVLAFGNSQSGRYLRNHIELGFNQDECNRQVFDGVLTNVAGIGKVFCNVAFGQPYRTATQHEDHAFPENWFPFSHATVNDPVSGRSTALLRNNGFDPLIIEINTATEYWQKGASLLHTDPGATCDLEIPSTVRLFLMASTQHGGRAGLTPSRGSGYHLSNPHNPTPAHRALLVALDQWVSEGIEPPASRVPRLADGSLVPPAHLAFPPIPGVQAPRRANRIEPLADWVYPPQIPASPYVALVPAVDADGNDVAGIRLPPIAVPLATYTGWNLYREPYPEGELCDRQGSYLPFAGTPAERQPTGDPRSSLAERYGSQETYVQQVEAVAQVLVAERLLLPADAERYVAEARCLDLLQSS